MGRIGVWYISVRMVCMRPVRVVYPITMISMDLIRVGIIKVTRICVRRITVGIISMSDILMW